RAFIANSPVLLLADGLIATHAAPIKNADLEEIKGLPKSDKRIYFALWARLGIHGDERHIYTISDVEDFRCRLGQPDALFVVGHSPHLVPEDRFHQQVARRHHIIYAARDVFGYAVFKNGGKSIDFVEVSNAKTPQGAGVILSCNPSQLWAGFLIGSVAYFFSGSGLLGLGLALGITSILMFVGKGLKFTGLLRTLFKLLLTQGSVFDIGTDNSPRRGLSARFTVRQVEKIRARALREVGFILAIPVVLLLAIACLAKKVYIHIKAALVILALFIVLCGLPKYMPANAQETMPNTAIVKTHSQPKPDTKPKFEALQQVISSDKDLNLRLKAIRELAALKDEPGVFQLLSGLASNEKEDMSVRSEAIYVMAMFDKEEAKIAKILTTILDKERKGSLLRYAAISNLVKFKNPEVRNYLIKIVKTPKNHSERKEAVKALGGYKEDQEIFGLLVSVVSDPYEDPLVSVEAIKVAGGFRNPRLVEPLLKALESNFASVRRCAITELGQLKACEAVPALIEALQDVNPGVRDDAINSLRIIINSSDDVQLILECIKIPEIRSDAMQRLREVSYEDWDRIKKAEAKQVLFIFFISFTPIFLFLFVYILMDIEFKKREREVSPPSQSIPAASGSRPAQPVDRETEALCAQVFAGIPEIAKLDTGRLEVLKHWVEEWNRCFKQIKWLNRGDFIASLRVFINKIAIPVISAADDPSRLSASKFLDKTNVVPLPMRRRQAAEEEMVGTYQLVDYTQAIAAVGDFIKTRGQLTTAATQLRDPRGTHTWQIVWQFLAGVVVSLWNPRRAKQNFFRPAIISYRINLEYLRRAHGTRAPPWLTYIYACVSALFYPTCERRAGKTRWNIPQEQFLIIGKQLNIPEPYLNHALGIILLHESEKTEILGLAAQYRQSDFEGFTVVALGGNALPGAFVQQEAAFAKTLPAIENMIASGYRLIFTHGNGPQVGDSVVEDTQNAMPMFVHDARTQGSLGLVVAQGLNKVLKGLLMSKEALACLTRVVVAEDDPSFKKPGTKQIGKWYTKPEAEAESQKHPEWEIKKIREETEDNKKVYRRVVPSPQPIDIVEIEYIRRLVRNGVLLVTCGGGGIPVIRFRNGLLRGVDCVIDKDRTSALLAVLLGAKKFIILTNVKEVSLNYGKPNEEPLRKATISQVRRLLEEGHFGTGDMAPKIQAAIYAIENGIKQVIITDAGHLLDALQGKEGTMIVADKKPGTLKEKLGNSLKNPLILQLLILAVFFIFLPFEHFFKAFPLFLIASAIKFASLGTFGELRGARIRLGEWLINLKEVKCKFCIIWPVLGVIIKVAFEIYKWLIPILLGLLAIDGSTVLFTIPITGIQVTPRAVAISILMNISFGYVLMALHRFLDNYFGNREWSLRFSRLTPMDFKGVIPEKDETLLHYLFKNPYRTLYWFWIPWHIITFSLTGGGAQITWAAIGGVVLGIILGLTAKGKGGPKVQAGMVPLITLLLTKIHIPLKHQAWIEQGAFWSGNLWLWVALFSNNLLDMLSAGFLSTAITWSIFFALHFLRTNSMPHAPPGWWWGVLFITLLNAITIGVILTLASIITIPYLSYALVLAGAVSTTAIHHYLNIKYITYLYRSSFAAGTKSSLDHAIINNQERFAQLLDTAEISAALSREAVRAHSSPFNELIQMTRPHPAQIESACLGRVLVNGSTFIDLRRGQSQDAYSLRGIPQIHGAVRRMLNCSREALDRERRSMDEGYGINQVAVNIAQDQLAIAAVALAGIAERRMFRLVDPELSNGLPEYLTPDPGANSGMMIPQYTAASQVAKMRNLAESLSHKGAQINSLDIAWRNKEILDCLENVLAIELLMAAQGIDLYLESLRPDESQPYFNKSFEPVLPCLGEGTKQAYVLIRNSVPMLVEDREQTPDIEAIKELVRKGVFSGFLRAFPKPSLTDAADTKADLISSEEALTHIKLDGNHLTPEQLCQVAFNPETTIEIDQSRRTQILVEREVACREQGYGIDSGVASLANHHLGKEDEKLRLQRNLLKSHSAGIGEPMPIEMVRAMLIIRVNTFLHGHSGVRWSLIEYLIEMLRRGIIPVVPQEGSVGASGDLAPLAHLANAALGCGEVFYQNKRILAKEALQQAGLKTLELSYKEGLSLINGTSFSTAYAAISLIHLEQMVERVAAFSLNRKQLQVLQAVAEALPGLRSTITIELNSTTDNPLVIGKRVLSGGNFHGEPIAMVLDTMNILWALLGNIIAQRIRPRKRLGLVNRNLTAMEIFAQPVSIHSIPTAARSQEDFVSMSALGAVKSAKMADLIENLLQPKPEPISWWQLSPAAAASPDSARTRPGHRTPLPRKIKAHVRTLGNLSARKEIAEQPIRETISRLRLANKNTEADRLQEFLDGHRIREVPKEDVFEDIFSTVYTNNQGRWMLVAQDISGPVHPELIPSLAHETGASLGFPEEENQRLEEIVKVAKLRKIGDVFIEEDDISGIPLTQIPHETLLSRLKFAVRELGIYPQADRSGFLRLLLLESEELAKRVALLRAATSSLDFIADFATYPRLLVFDNPEQFTDFTSSLSKTEDAKAAGELVNQAVAKLYPKWLIGKSPKIKTEPYLYEETDAAEQIKDQERRNQELAAQVSARAEESRKALTTSEEKAWRRFKHLLMKYYHLSRQEKEARNEVLNKIGEIGSLFGKFTLDGYLYFGEWPSGRRLQLRRLDLKGIKVGIKLAIEQDRIRISIYRLGDDFHYLESFYYNEEEGRKIYLAEQLGRWINNVNGELRPQCAIQRVIGTKNGCAHF
ncbi:MAG: aromatic amino acid lyase, partial [Bacteroidales bacterium]